MNASLPRGTCDAPRRQWRREHNLGGAPTNAPNHIVARPPRGAVRSLIGPIRTEPIAEGVLHRARISHDGVPPPSAHNRRACNRLQRHSTSCNVTHQRRFRHSATPRRGCSGAARRVVTRSSLGLRRTSPELAPQGGLLHRRAVVRAGEDDLRVGEVGRVKNDDAIRVLRLRQPLQGVHADVPSLRRRVAEAADLLPTVAVPGVGLL